MKFRTRLIIFYLATTILSMMIIGSAILGSLELYKTKTVKNQLKEQSQLIISYIEQVFLFEKEGTTELSSATAKLIASSLSSGIGQVQIYNKNLKLQCNPVEVEEESSFKDAQYKKVILEPAMNGEVVYKTKNRVVYYSVPIVYNSQRIGVLVIVYKLDLLNEYLNKVLYILLIGAFAFCCLIIVTSIYISKKMVKPINQLVETTKRYAQRDFTVIGFDRNDELGQLSKSIDSMGMQLQEYIGMQKQLISNVSHEIRTPLTAIKGYSEFLYDEIAGNPDTEAALMHLNSEALRLEKLVNDLLNLSKLDSFQDINYFKRHYDTPTNDTFSIYTEVTPSVFNKGYHMIEVGIQGKQVYGREKKNSVLTFVIDVSGSMNTENRFGLVKESLNLLIDQMTASDKIGIAVYGTKGRKLIEHTSGDKKDFLIKKIERLEPEGSTNASEGLQIGFEMANRNFDESANNRIILCTDGVANQGLTDAEDILKTIEDYSKRGIALSAFGFGMDNYNDMFMEKLADKGDGNYSYIDSLDEAQRIFTEELTSVLQVIAKDAKAQVEFDKSSVETYRLIGYENRDIKDSEFRNNNVDAGEIGAGHAVTALYEIKLKESLSDNIAVVKLRYKNMQTEKVDEISKTIKASEIKKDFYDATARFRFLNMVAQFAEILRGSQYADSSINKVYDLLKADEKELVASKEDSAFIELVSKAAAFDSNVRREQKGQRE